MLDYSQIHNLGNEIHKQQQNQSKQAKENEWAMQTGEIQKARD